jgi:DNA polymerase-4
MDHPDEATISLLGISVSHLTKQAEYQLDLPLGGDSRCRAPARGAADGALDTIRERFGWKAIGYGSVVLDPSRSVPDEFRELAEHELL